MPLPWSQKRFLIWSVLAFLVWWAGVGPSDAYGLFVLIALVEMLGWALRKQWVSNVESLVAWVKELSTQARSQRLVVLFLVTNSLVWLLVVVLRFYGFGLFTWDAGIFSNILYNNAHGEFFSSYLQVNNLGDHFSPSYSLLSVFYLITPHIHWMMISKWVCFVVTPILFYKLLLFELDDKAAARRWGLLLAALWLVFYAPSVNAMRYEFQPSALAPPFVAAAYLFLRKSNGLMFWLTMVFLLGFKEHLGAVWIGFGLSMVLHKERPKLGVFLMVSGTLVIYLTMFQAMPYFRDYAPSWSGLERVNLWADIPQKAWYLVRLVLPLGMLPLLFWKRGIMAGPAIGVNLLSRVPTMYSAHYHYDDISSTLLILSVIVSVKGLPALKPLWGAVPTGVRRTGLFFAFFIALNFLPRSAPRYLFETIPTAAHLELGKSLDRFNQAYPDAEFITQDVLGPHLLRRNIRAIKHWDDFSCLGPLEVLYEDLPFRFVLLSPVADAFQVHDLPGCIRDLEESEDYEKFWDQGQLLVFERKASL